MTIRSLRAAISFLTVLPVANADGSPGERLGRAYFPAIGALIGLAAGLGFVVLGTIMAPLLAAGCWALGATRRVAWRSCATRDWAPSA